MKVFGDGWKCGRYDGDVDGDDKCGDADCEKDEPEAPAFAHFGRRGLSSFPIGAIAGWFDGRQRGVSLAVALMKRRHDDFEARIRKCEQESKEREGGEATGCWSESGKGRLEKNGMMECKVESVSSRRMREEKVAVSYHIISYHTLLCSPNSKLCCFPADILHFQAKGSRGNNSADSE